MLGSLELASPPPGRLKEIQAGVVGDLNPVRPLAPAGIYFAAFAVIFAAVSVVSGYYIAGHFGWDALSNLQKSLVFFALIATAALLVFSLVRQMTPGAKYMQSAAVYAAGLFALLLALMPLLFHPEPEPGFLNDAWICFRAGVLFALPAAVLITLLFRRGAPTSRPLAGATVGGLAGLAGMTALEIHCPNLNVYHIVASHVSVSLVCAIAGFIFSSVTFPRWMSNH
jgi:hypothetical protein